MKMKKSIFTRKSPIIQICKIKLFLGILFFFTIHITFGQHQKLNILLKHLIQNHENKEEQVHLLAVGDPVSIRRFCEQNQGHYKYHIQSINSISLPIIKLEEFSEMNYVERIEFSGNFGKPLNDNIRSNINIDSAHKGFAPLFDSLTGKGVIIGVIDASMEVNHPDFLDHNGKSRLLYYWNQSHVSSLKPQPYNYGTEWNNEQINLGLVVPNGNNDHGAHVTGTAAGNGKANGLHKGMAPEADIIYVDYATNPTIDFAQSVADAVHYIFNKADSLNKPCVINISLGTYRGSHDGKDPATKIIDQLINEKPGRAVVCAAGNSGSQNPYHVSYPVTSDTNFTWFKYNSATWFGFAGLMVEIWADTQDLKDVYFSVGADKMTPNIEFRGATSFKKFTVGNVEEDLYSISGNYLGTVGTYVEIQEGVYYIQLYMVSPDSSQYYYRLSTTGTGKFDIWSSPNITGTSEIASLSTDVFPDSLTFPEIVKYKFPDRNKHIVNNWACSPHVITVGNYVNTNTYVDYNGVSYLTSATPGLLSYTSSHGPTRDDRIKPDISAPGQLVFSCARLNNLANYVTSIPSYVAPGGYHLANSGTSMASPAVAGSVALFFEKCPNASVHDFYQHMIQTAFTDSFTGITPNNAYGYGKLNAFGILKNANTKPELNFYDTLVCSQVEASVQNTFNSYYWSHGDTSQTSIISTEGIHTVWGFDGLCYSKSEDIYVELKDSSVYSIQINASGMLEFCEGDSVILSTDGLFTNYIWNDGTTGISNSVKQTGLYYVTAKDEKLCTVFSDTMLAVSKINPPKPEIKIKESSLESSLAFEYQWYKNNIALTDSVYQTIYPKDAAWYFVETSHINGCSSFSDSVYFSLVSVHEWSNHQTIIFPNPTNDYLYVKAEEEITHLQLQNVHGSILWENFEKTYPKNTKMIDLSSFPQGFYILRVRLKNNEQISFKIELL